MPDVMALSGAKLVEIGTTNRTRLSDYENAIGENTRAIMRVHRGNFRLDGFVESPPLEDVCAIAHGQEIPVIVDLGHGSMHDLNFPSNDGLPGTIQACIDQGADLVLGSGDKLVGGPQAGLAVGKKSLVQKMRKHALHRALRIDKLTTAALEVVLHDHLSGRLDRIPALATIQKTTQELREQSERVVAAWAQANPGGDQDRAYELEAVPCTSHVGGGSDAHYQLSSHGISLKHHMRGPDYVANLLRQLSPPVIGRIHEDRIILDLRTVLDDELSTLEDQLINLCTEDR